MVDLAIYIVSTVVVLTAGVAGLGLLFMILRNPVVLGLILFAIMLILGNTNG